MKLRMNVFVPREVIKVKEEDGVFHQIAKEGQGDLRRRNDERN